jgi:hypothetical protein
VQPSTGVAHPDAMAAGVVRLVVVGLGLDRARTRGLPRWLACACQPIAAPAEAVTDEVPGPLAGRVPFAMDEVHPVPAAPAGSRQHVMASDNEPTDFLLKPGEVARLLRVTTVTLTNWSRAGKLTPVLTPGGHRRYRASEIAQYLRRPRRAP